MKTRSGVCHISINLPYSVPNTSRQGGLSGKIIECGLKAATDCQTISFSWLGYTPSWNPQPVSLDEYAGLESVITDVFSSTIMIWMIEIWTVGSVKWLSHRIPG